MSSTQQLLLGEGAGGGIPNFIEEVFSTFPYTGNVTARSITNNIDLSTKGGLVWGKNRLAAGEYHRLSDTVRGGSKLLYTNTSDAEATQSNISAFNATGFSLTDDSALNYNTNSYVSWTFREQPKFFDIVTYTGDGIAGRTVTHNLGSVPGCIIVKLTSSSQDWRVYHRSLGATKYLNLNENAAEGTLSTIWNNTEPTSSVFSVGTNSSVNNSGSTYIAYIFAHDAGGFGLTGADNVITCGSFNTDGGGDVTVSLGYEPQWLMVKKTSSVGNWTIFDSMRGIPTNGDDKMLFPNTDDIENGSSDYVNINATGFSIVNNGFGALVTCVYVAIRRGPMKVPTVGTSVFNIDTQGSSAGKPNFKSGSPVDFAFVKETGGSASLSSSRLTSTKVLYFNNGNAQATDTERTFDYSNGWGNSTSVDATRYSWMFQRAPSFMDVVCYTGTGTYGAANHNLGVTPELVIYKSRSNAVNWGVIKPVSSIAYYDGLLNSSSAFTYYSNDPSVAGLYTSTQFCKYQDTSAYTYVAYLFATCAGVSKVGTYNGNTGYTVTVPCGFTAGVRFVLIKRTDSTGDWYFWDSARGIIAGDDPYLLLNTLGAQVTGTDYVDTYSAGFEVTSTAPAALNATGGTYIFLAIA